MKKMIQLPSINPIKFLIGRKYPDWRYLKYPSAFTAHKLGLMTEDEKTERLRAIEEYEKELSSKSPDEIRQQYAIEMIADEKERKIKAVQDEKERFFHQPNCQADFGYWSKAAYWTHEEAIALLHGKEPSRVTWRRVSKHLGTSPFANAFEKSRELVLRAINSGQLQEPINPKKFITWATQLGLQVPDELAECIEKLEELPHLTKLPLPPKAETKKRGNYQQTESWQHLEKLTEKAIDEFLAWSQNQRKIQNTGNLKRWLVENLGAKNREADFIIQVLKEIFKEIK